MFFLIKVIFIKSTRFSTVTPTWFLDANIIQRYYVTLKQFHYVPGTWVWSRTISDNWFLFYYITHSFKKQVLLSMRGSFYFWGKLMLNLSNTKCISHIGQFSSACWKLLDRMVRRIRASLKTSLRLHVIISLPVCELTFIITYMIQLDKLNIHFCNIIL